METQRDQKRLLSQETWSPMETHRDPRRPGDTKRRKEIQIDTWRPRDLRLPKETQINSRRLKEKQRDS